MHTKESIGMAKLQKLEISIERLRKIMHEKIQRQENLLSPEILTISQQLDKLLNEYDQEVTKAKLAAFSKTLSVML
ncbi:hypothetical protein HNQ80_002841 [Anaerosolibacter carboniphilus]|uniref:Spo0E like sporulation regulatory protein n=1 Tax=Anaerosolibacter carboniphilus TaxID=1417629 RepID=A0A841KTJ0_9FIRM|nr:aspartyl-phosphate phosphatase Spo0E family protein [Anaerosolibacter carboniphilus]MBB6216737.1 hypothetical protein [Anaerosolibacter carboniphilus]